MLGSLGKYHFREKLTRGRKQKMVMLLWIGKWEWPCWAWIELFRISGAEWQCDHNAHETLNLGKYCCIFKWG